MASDTYSNAVLDELRVDNGWKKNPYGPRVHNVEKYMPVIEAIVSIDSIEERGAYQSEMVVNGLEKYFQARSDATDLDSVESLLREISGSLGAVGEITFSVSDGRIELLEVDSSQYQATAGLRMGGEVGEYVYTIRDGRDEGDHDVLSNQGKKEFEGLLNQRLQERASLKKEFDEFKLDRGGPNPRERPDWMKPEHLPRLEREMEGHYDA